MPKWVEIEETGILLRGPTGPVLSMPGGGYWCLEPSSKLKASFYGTRITVIGLRVGFNEISIYRVIRR